MAKGNFIGYVVSDIENKYPDDGTQDGYYWEKCIETPVLISFTAAGTSYQAEENMTWEEWVNSSYNTGGFTINDSYIFIGSALHLNTGEPVVKTDYIFANATYICISYTDCCFIPRTQVQITLDGETKSIENLMMGDTVVSYNISNNEFYLAEILGIRINSTSYDMAKVKFDNGSELEMTSYHPILTTDGFHSITKHEGLPELVEGDIAITTTGESTITEIYRYWLEDPIVTYSLDVHDFDENPDDDTNDTFIANSIVVHNADVACPISPIAPS